MTRNPEPGRSPRLGRPGRRGARPRRRTTSPTRTSRSAAACCSRSSTSRSSRRSTLKPDLITISAGGNDIIRPGTDPDDVASRFEGGIERLRRDGATVVMFNGPDIGMTPVLRRVRGKVAIYNENLRAIAQRHDAIVADMWALRELERLRGCGRPTGCTSPPSATTRSRAWCWTSLNVENDLEPLKPEPAARVVVAPGACRGRRVGPRALRAVGAAAHPPPVVGRRRSRRSDPVRDLNASTMSSLSRPSAGVAPYRTAAGQSNGSPRRREPDLVEVADARCRTTSTGRPRCRGCRASRSTPSRSRRARLRCGRGMLGNRWCSIW